MRSANLQDARICFRDLLSLAGSIPLADFDCQTFTCLTTETVKVFVQFGLRFKVMLCCLDPMASTSCKALLKDPWFESEPSLIQCEYLLQRKCVQSATSNFSCWRAPAKLSQRTF